jgi:CheY-like chemotaxis protein
MATTILLVDDSKTIRLLVRAYLVGKGFEFLEMENGAAALRVVRSRLPALVICDVFMPGVGGWDFVRALRADARSEVSRVPVILVSSKQDAETARRSLEAGANAFLTKPIAGERLVKQIEDLLGRSSAPISQPSILVDDVPPTSRRFGFGSEDQRAPSSRRGSDSLPPPSKRGGT